LLKASQRGLLLLDDADLDAPICGIDLPRMSATIAASFSASAARSPR